MSLKETIKVKSNISDLTRLGPNRDGGYVVNKKVLELSDVLYNYGVGNEYNFEKQYSDLFPNKHIRMFDPTIGKLQVDRSNIFFLEEGLNAYEKNKTSFEDHLIRFDDLNKNIFLKFDVEGHEYEFLNNLDKTNLKNVIGIVSEFHWLFESKYREQFINILTDTLNDYDIVHIHGNNHVPMLDSSKDELNGFAFPSTIEVSFIRKDLNPCSVYVSRNYPVFGLDYPNFGGLPDQQFSVFE